METSRFSFIIYFLIANIFVLGLNPKLEAQNTKSTDPSSAKEITILANQVAYNLDGPKTAIITSGIALADPASFQIINTTSGDTVFNGKSGKSEQVTDWNVKEWYSPIDFSTFQKSGDYKIRTKFNGRIFESYDFKIEDNALGKIAIPAIVNFFYHQRANSPEELEADKNLILYGSDKTVDLHGGWCDASGDISKYFSHLAYANFMSPQQIPMVTWSMVNTTERVSDLLAQIGAKESLTSEAIYGADYLMRSLSPEGYFYMTVFSYFNKDPKARRVVGLLADSKTTSDYQYAYREGGGMAVAALARISQWETAGDFTSKQYLDAAERAFAHLQKFSTKYADDGKDNVIDDYCALMAASELWIATGKDIYRDEARKRASNLHNRLSSDGYFIANDANRPFWHAADAGLPIISLARYLDKEKDVKYRDTALATIKTAIGYNLKVTREVVNPFGYARQSFLFKGMFKSDDFKKMFGNAILWAAKK